MKSKTNHMNDPQQLQSSDLLPEFIGNNTEYYSSMFNKIGSTAKVTFTLNTAAAVFGSIFFAARGIWNWALIFVLVETFAFVQIARGAFGDLTTDMTNRLKTIASQLDIRRAQLQAAIDKGSEKVEQAKTNVANLEAIYFDVENAIIAAEASRIWVVLFGVLLLISARIFQCIFANIVLERRFSEWLSKGVGVAVIRPLNIVFGLLFSCIIIVVTVIEFAQPGQVNLLSNFPTTSSFRDEAIVHIESFFEWVTLSGEGFWYSVSWFIRSVLDLMELIFTGIPWMVMIALVVALTTITSGLRAALWAGAFLIYMGLVGLWLLSMQTLALLGTAAFIAIGLGVPLGIYAARRPRFYNFIRPILDFQQSMPAFVYMIPIITIFGTGKPSAVVTCLIFGMPPSVRLTVLGLQGVPASIREAAIAYGANNWYLLTKVDLPLAAKSIRTGMNQTILLSLLTVVIASLIGAAGLGEDVLEALQYASVGQGILAGLAILFIAMMIDGIVQGKHKNG
tara:strand:+ start:262 stop:1785 length:1524 start_codon:yes stop_codon:yes gene_type:complete